MGRVSDLMETLVQTVPIPVKYVLYPYATFYPRMLDSLPRRRLAAALGTEGDMGWMKLLLGPKGAKTARAVTKVSRALAPAPVKAGPVRLAGSGDYDQEVVGESFNQEALDALCGGKREAGHDLAVVATLQPEPSNPHDRNAVAVMVRGRKVAYLSRPDAAAFHRDMRRLGAAGADASCKARITGGWLRPRKDGTADDGHYGVELDLDWPLARA